MTATASRSKVKRAALGGWHLGKLEQNSCRRHSTGRERVLRARQIWRMPRCNGLIERLPNGRFVTRTFSAETCLQTAQARIGRGGSAIGITKGGAWLPILPSRIGSRSGGAQVKMAATILIVHHARADCGRHSAEQSAAGQFAQSVRSVSLS